MISKLVSESFGSLFYYFYMPTASFSWPLYFDYHERYPATVVPLDSSPDSYGSRVLSHNQGKPKALHALLPSQPTQLSRPGYHFYVELEVPTSSVNRNAGELSLSALFQTLRSQLHGTGMFMVTLRLLSSKRAALSQPLRQHLVARHDSHTAESVQVTTQAWDAEFEVELEEEGPTESKETEDTPLKPLIDTSRFLAVARPTMLPYRSFPIRVIRTVMLIMPLTLGLIPETEVGASFLCTVLFIR